MTQPAPPPRRALVVLAIVVAIAVAGEIAATAVSTGSTAKDIVTGTGAWRWLAPFAVAAAIAAIGWLWHARRVRVAAWTAAAVLGTALYDVSSSVLAAALDDPAASPVLVTVASAGITLWVTVIAALQLAALSLAHPRWLRLGRIYAVVVVAMIAVSSVLLVGDPALVRDGRMLSLLPAEVLESTAVLVVSSVAYYSWAAFVIGMPVVLWIGVARMSGKGRVIAVRAAVGTTIPLLVVMLCGVLAATVRAEGNLEGTSLATGFTIALALSAWWLVAAVVDTAPGARRRFTTVSAAVQAGLWVFYALAIAQVAIPIGLAVGGDSPVAAVALATVGVGAATLWPWQRLVAWCGANVAPRRSLVARLVSADPDLSRRDPLALAERVTRAVRLGDASRVLVRLPDGRWVDRYGIRAQDPDPGRDDTSLARDRSGTVYAAIVDHEQGLDLDPVFAELAPVLWRGALAAELSDNAERLERERLRADSAADDERRRLERDLHDGVQARLLSLGLNLGIVADGIDDPTARLALAETIDGLRDAVAELRTLAAGKLPTALSRGGLRSALEELLAPVPLDVSLEVAQGPFGARVESAAYFVVAEAVSNALKHSAAQSVDVRLVRTGSVLTVTVEDDGHGGADPRAGTGLRGLGERVHGAGGRLLVADLHPHGTQLEASLPCE